MNEEIKHRDAVIEQLKCEQAHKRSNATGQQAFVRGRVSGSNGSRDTLLFDHICSNAQQKSQTDVLTKALLEKQALIEALIAEKNTMVIKMENFEVSHFILQNSK